MACLYGTIVAQARAPAFYQTTFPDSMEVAAADPARLGSQVNGSERAILC